MSVDINVTVNRHLKNNVARLELWSTTIVRLDAILLLRFYIFLKSDSLCKERIDKITDNKFSYK